MTTSRWGLAALVMVLVLATATSPTATAAVPGGIGVMGDSYSDEYVFYPPDRSTARNWVEILAAARGLDFGAYSTASRAEPRNQGFAYNWARSDATTDDLIATGQHTGLARQVAAGEVSYVFVFIGGNDFINALKAPEPESALAVMLPRALANYRLAVETVRSASPTVRLVLATVPEVRGLPEFAGLVREGRIPRSRLAAFGAGQRRFNAQVRALATGDPRMALIDLDLTNRAADLASLDWVLISGRRLDRVHPANDLDHFFLADVRHPGTLGQGMLARLFVDTLNVRFKAGIRPLSGPEVLAIAGGPGERPRFDPAVRLSVLSGPGRP